MRRQLRKLIPHHEAVRGNRWLAPFEDTLLHPRLWHLNRHSVAGAVAAGLACGLIPGPFQMLGAAICALVFRVNLPLALVTTLYTNPLTIVPIYLLAFGLGEAALALVGHDAGSRFVAPPEYEAGGLLAWLKALAAWTVSLGKPLVLGLVLLAGLLAFVGYFAVRFAWRLHLIRAWRHRAAHRASRAHPPKAP